MEMPEIAVNLPEFTMSSPAERLLAMLGVVVVMLLTWMFGRWLGRRMKGTTRLGLQRLDRLAAPSALMGVSLGILFALNAMEERQAFLIKVGEVVLVFGGFWLASRGLEVLLTTAARSARLRQSATVQAALLSARRLGKVVIWLVGAVTVAVQLGAGSNLYLLLGGLGAALAVGARDPIRNALAFLGMLVDPPFRLGDRVRLDDFRGRITTEGIVQSVSLASVTLQTDQGTRVFIANVRIDELRVENLSAADHRRLELVVPVPRALSTEALRDACDAIEVQLKDHAQVTGDKEAMVWIAGSGTGLQLKAAVWLKEASVRREVQKELLLMIRERLEGSTHRDHRDDAPSKPRGETRRRPAPA